MNNSSTLKKRFLRKLVFTPVLALFCLKAHAIDVDPRDYIAAPLGVNLAILYSGLINNTDEADAKFDANVNIARFVFYRKLGGMTIDPQILIPFGSQELDINGGPSFDTDGFADPILASTFWVYETEKTQLGLTPFLSIPIGSYDNAEALNFGENRYNLTLQAGYINKITPKFIFGATADITFHSDNDDFGEESVDREQDSSLQLQLDGSYNFTEKFDAGVNLSWQQNGETTVGGVEQNDEAEITKVSLSSRYWFKPDWQLQLKYSRDVDSEVATVRETQLFQFRIVHVF